MSQEFADITAEPTLDDHYQDQTDPEDMSTHPSDDRSLKQLDTATMRLLKDVHGQLFTEMVSTDWLKEGNGQTRPTLDHGTVARLGYTAGTQLIRDVLPYMGKCCFITTWGRIFL